MSCSWCHAMNEMLGFPVVCRGCGHRADVPRLSCDCPRCKPTPAERERQRRLDELSAEYLAAVASGDAEAAGKLWEMAETDLALAARLHRLDADIAALGIKKGA